MSEKQPPSTDQGILLLTLYRCVVPAIFADCRIGDSPTSAKGSSYTEMASNAANAAASSASTTAVNMKDNVFSMFGGGAKREKKEEEEVDEKSGSSKAKKEAEAEEDDVSL